MNRLLLCGLAVSAMLATTGRRRRQRSVRQIPSGECLAEQDRRPETARTDGQDRPAPQGVDREGRHPEDISLGVGQLQEGKARPKLKNRR